MGGHARGEVAAQITLQTMAAIYQRDAKPLLPDPARFLEDSVLAAHRELHRYRAEHSLPEAPRTTVVACVVQQGIACWAHAGDSRLYQIRGTQAVQLTRDHTVANEQVKLGILSSKEVAGSQHKHMLVRSLGTDPFTTADLSEHLIEPGDIILLCSDGLHNSVERSEMGAVAGQRHADLNAAARRLIALANDRDGSDNISVLLIRIRDIERVGMYRGRPYKLR